MDKLTIEQVQEMITLGAFYGCEERRVLAQLLDTMRDNERLRDALSYALWQHEGRSDPLHNHWSAKAREALQPNKHPDGDAPLLTMDRYERAIKAGNGTQNTETKLDDVLEAIGPEHTKKLGLFVMEKIKEAADQHQQFKNQTKTSGG